MNEPKKIICMAARKDIPHSEKHKGILFVRLFHGKQELLSLYNAMHISKDFVAYLQKNASGIYAYWRKYYFKSISC